jgi:hypothetical protein
LALLSVLLLSSTRLLSLLGRLLHRQESAIDATTYILSYGFKSIFLGLDHLRTEVGLPAFELANTWAPALITTLVLTCDAAGALINFRFHRVSCKVATNVAGTAFIFGSSIYCGTFLLGTNFIYRLTFLLLCLPQLQDWSQQESEKNTRIMCWLLMTVSAVLWLNGLHLVSQTPS